MYLTFGMANIVEYLKKQKNEQLEKISIIIPTKEIPNQFSLLKKAIDSIASQTISNQFDITILISVDMGCPINVLELGHIGFKIQCIESSGYSQAKALNSAIEVADSDFVAFLEDDDQWMPDYLSNAIGLLTDFDFVSSTQLEVNGSGEIIRIFDFPTPSGWLMPLSTLQVVGGFNESYRYHIDNEWLGRLSESKLRRVHLIESTAPLALDCIAEARPMLANVINASLGFSYLARHTSPYPLVKRLVHENSGMHQIKNNESLLAISHEEWRLLTLRFGKLPW